MHWLPRDKCRRRRIRSAVWSTAILLLLMGATVAMPGPAGAAAPQIAQFWVHGSEVPTSPVPEFTPNEAVEVEVPANSILQPGQRADILMCSDPGGSASQLPVDDTSCAGITLNVGRTLDIEPGGKVDKPGYVMYRLPNQLEPKDSVPVCNATHACVLYVGQDQNDFDRPFVWSTPFHVGTGPDAGGTTSASGSSASGSGSSAPVVGGIVAAAVIVVAGFIVRRRRHSRVTPTR